MIEKSRLEELITQEKGCYILANPYTIGYIHLNKKYEPIIEEENDFYRLWVFTNDSDDFRDCINDYNLFETKEEAEWYLEFGNIERTEKLILPTWEEAQDERFYYIKNFESLTGIHFFISIYKFTNDFEISCSHGSKIGDYHIERHFDLRDKKQYLEACRLAKKLFLGEEV